MEFNHVDVELGECKAYGEAWNNAEAHARFVLGIPADKVRELSAQGYDTVAQFEAYSKGEEPVIETKEEVKEVVVNEPVVEQETITGPSIETLREFLKSKEIKSSHLYGYEKALQTAIDNGFII